MNKTLIRNIGIYAGIVLLFAVLAYGFVPQVLEGKIVNQSDISSWEGMANEIVSHNKANPDDPTLWTNSMFGGMPATSISVIYEGDFTVIMGPSGSGKSTLLYSGCCSNCVDPDIVVFKIKHLYPFQSRS